MIRDLAQAGSAERSRFPAANVMLSIQLLLGPTKLESTVRYLGIEVDDALEISEQIEIQADPKRSRDLLTPR